MQLILMDSISAIGPSHSHAFVVTGSHGGVSAAQFVLSCDAYPNVVAFNDAGVGKANAGIAALKMLEDQGIMALAYSHISACIGDAKDAWLHGSVSHVNAAATAFGVKVGMTIQAAYRVCAAAG